MEQDQLSPRRAMPPVLEPQLPGARERLAGLSNSPEHVGGARSGGGRRLSDLRQHLLRSAERRLEQGWPPETTYADKPSTMPAPQFMNVQQVPDNQWTDRMKLMKKAPIRSGGERSVQKAGACCVLRIGLDLHQDDQHRHNQEQALYHAQGVEQGTACIWATVTSAVRSVRQYARTQLHSVGQKHGAQVRPLHLVTNIEPSRTDTRTLRRLRTEHALPAVRQRGS